MNVKRNGNGLSDNQLAPKRSVYMQHKKQVSCPNCGMRAVPVWKKSAGKLRARCRSCGTVVA